MEKFQIECFRPDVVLLSSDKKILSVFSYNLITFAKIEVEHEVIKESNFGDDWITVFCPTALEIQFAIPDGLQKNLWIKNKRIFEKISFR